MGLCIVRLLLLLVWAAALSAGEYSTYIGDSNRWSIGQVLVDASGHTYVAGSRTFDLSYDPLRPNPVSEAIVAKIDTNGRMVLFANIGGKGSDAANAVALDPAGNIYIGGSTRSPNFPVRNGLFSAASGGFVVKYNPTASDVLWSTYFPQPVTALAADLTGVYVAGMARGAMPVTAGLPGWQPPSVSNYGAYLTKIAAAGDRIVYSTVISGVTKPCGCCSSCFTSMRGASVVGAGVDAAGNAYFGGNSDVTDLPTTSGVMTPKGAGAWVAKVNASGTSLGYLTYITPGGVTFSPYFTPDSSMSGFAVDAAGHVFVAGGTVAKDLPVTSGAYLKTPNGAYALELKEDGTGVVWASYLGAATGPTSVATAAIDPTGNFWVAGNTRAYDFPNANGWSTGDDFIVGFNGTGALIYSGRYPTGTVKELAVDSAKLLHVGEPGGVLSAIAADAHPAPRPWFVGLYGGQIAPSEVISIFGPHIGGLPVTINGIAPVVLYSSDQQVNLVVPAEIANRTTAAIRVGNGPEFTAGVVPTAPQIFGALNQDGTVNSAEHRAPVGSVMSVWVTGFGAVTDPSSVFAGFIYTANGEGARWLYSGQAPGLPLGVGQINFVVPDAGGIVLSAGQRISEVFPIFVTR